MGEFMKGFCPTAPCPGGWGGGGDMPAAIFFYLTAGPWVMKLEPRLERAWGVGGGVGALRDSSRAIAPKKKKRKIAVGQFVCFG